jgi:hypothetical protein
MVQLGAGDAAAAAAGGGGGAAKWFRQGVGQVCCQSSGGDEQE